MTAFFSNIANDSWNMQLVAQLNKHEGQFIRIGTQFFCQEVFYMKYDRSLHGLAHKQVSDTLGEHRKFNTFLDEV